MAHSCSLPGWGIDQTESFGSRNPKSMTQSRITCVVPTHHRPQFLRRLFEFYSNWPPSFSFLVVDSSQPQFAAENRCLIDRVSGQLSIAYQHIERSFVDKCTQALETLATPFVVFCADDDLLFSETVQECVAFLEQHAEFATALGYSPVLDCGRRKGRCQVGIGMSLEDPQPLARCRQMARVWFSTFYGVYRTPTLREIFQKTQASTDSQLTYFLPEMMLSQLSVLRGQVKVFPKLYGLREFHFTNAGQRPKVPAQPQAELLYRRFQESLVQELTESGTSTAVANQFVDHWFGYLRDPEVANGRRKRPTLERVQRFASSLLRQLQNPFCTDRNLHRRFLRPSDIRGQEAIWNAAVRLMLDYPQGLPMAGEPGRVAA